jgi:quercetin dioxygenase-like cupin family protein
MELKPVNPTAKAPASNFTGDVYVTPIYNGTGPSRMTVALVRFTPGAHTNWHSHAVGQTLHVTEGVGLVGTRDGTALRVRAGDTVVCPPGEEQWHGAAADTFMSHLAMLENLLVARTPPPGSSRSPTRTTSGRTGRSPAPPGRVTARRTDRRGPGHPTSRTGEERTSMTETGAQRFTGKVAFVTGAGSGIGRATALAFAAEGAAAAVAGIPEEDVRETARLIEQNSGRALPLTCDVTEEGDIKAALARTVETFGRLDLAFNNAGVEQSHTPTADLTTEEWHRIIHVDLTGVFLCMKHEIPLMQAAGGAIVNTSSGARRDRHRRTGRLRRRQVGRDRPDQVRRPGVRRRRHPDQRHLPRNHRHPDDRPGLRRHPRRPRGNDRPGADRPDGPPRGDRLGGAVAVLEPRRFTVGHALVVDGGQTVGR